MVKTMTEGDPLRLILEFTVPLLLGNLLQQTYNIVDAAIVGQVLGTQALAGVGATSSVQFLVIGFLVGVTCGFGYPLPKPLAPVIIKDYAVSFFMFFFVNGSGNVSYNPVYYILFSYFNALIHAGGHLYRCL